MDNVEEMTYGQLVLGMTVLTSLGWGVIRNIKGCHCPDNCSVQMVVIVGGNRVLHVIEPSDYPVLVMLEITPCIHNITGSEWINIVKKAM